MSHWSPSKWLLQSFPPDMSEAKIRWTFGVYEILDHRNSPVDPNVLHVTYRGAVELEPEAIPDPKDPLFTGKLEEAVTKKWKSLVRDHGKS